MEPKPTMGRGFTSGGRKGITKKGDYGRQTSLFTTSASATTGASKVNQGPFMDMAKGHGFGAGRRGKGGAHSSASAIGQRPKEGRRPMVGGSSK